MTEMMQSTGMIWGMGLIWLLVLADLILGGAALLKYLFANRSR